MKRRSILIASTVSLAAVGGLCWWMASKPQTDSVASPAASAAPEPQVQAPVEQKIGDYIQWLHPRVQIVVGAESAIDMSRKDAVDLLPRNLEPMDVKALLQFINDPAPTDCTGPSWHALVDAIINVIRRQETAAPGFSQSLVKLYQKSPDPVLKDYAIQYLRHLYVDRDETYKPETDLAARERILVTLIDAASQIHESYSGAAFMGLDDATTSSALQKEPETQAQLQAHANELNAALVKAATSAETHKLCRISAMQLCAKRGLRDILSAARSLAADAQADPSLRISAIAAIGRLGSLAEDQTLLQQLENSGARFADAATPALACLARKTR